MAKWLDRLAITPRWSRGGRAALWPEASLIGYRSGIASAVKDANDDELVLGGLRQALAELLDVGGHVQRLDIEDLREVLSSHQLENARKGARNSGAARAAVGVHRRARVAVCRSTSLTHCTSMVYGGVDGQGAAIDFH